MGNIFSKEDPIIQRSFSVPRTSSLLDEEEIQSVIKELEENTHNINEITIGNNEYTEESLNLLANSIQECQNITKADFSQVISSPNRPELVEILNSTLLCLHSLYEVNLSQNCLTEDTIDILSFLFHSDSLKILKINENLLGVEGAVKLAEAFRNSEIKLFVFCAEKNNLEDQGVFDLSEAFSNMKSLRQLSLSENRLGKDGIIEICQSMENNLELQILELSDSYINEESAFSALKSLILQLEYLSKLSLNDCFLGNNGGKEILEGLIESNNNFSYLSLGFNEIDDDEVGELIIKLQRTKKMLYVMIN